MKRLKRVLALTLAAVMLFTLGGCKKKLPRKYWKLPRRR